MPSSLQSASSLFHQDPPRHRATSWMSPNSSMGTKSSKQCSTPNPRTDELQAEVSAGAQAADVTPVHGLKANHCIGYLETSPAKDTRVEHVSDRALQDISQATRPTQYSSASHVYGLHAERHHERPQAATLAPNGTLSSRFTDNRR